MRAKLINLPFRADCGGFDDAPLAQLLEGVRDAEVAEYFFVRGDVPHFACFVRWREDVPLPGETAPALPGKAAAPPARKPRAKRNGDFGAPGLESVPLDARGERVADAMRGWRSARAKELGVPAYRVLTNRQLDALARARPAGLDALRAIDGIGPGTARTHGTALLALIRGPAD